MQLLNPCPEQSRASELFRAFRTKQFVNISLFSNSPSTNPYHQPSSKVRTSQMSCWYHISPNAWLFLCEGDLLYNPPNFSIKLQRIQVNHVLTCDWFSMIVPHDQGCILKDARCELRKIMSPARNQESHYLGYWDGSSLQFKLWRRMF